MKKTASAIKYEPGDSAPVLLASGDGIDAQTIISIAKEAGIDIIEDEALAALLSSWGKTAKPGDYLPEWCWEAIAKILSFVIKNRLK